MIHSSWHQKNTAGNQFNGLFCVGEGDGFGSRKYAVKFHIIVFVRPLGNGFHGRDAVAVRANVANSVEYSSVGNEYRLQVAVNGTYALTINGQEQKDLGMNDVIEKLGLQL